MTVLSDLDKTDKPTHLFAAVKARDLRVDAYKGGIDFGWNTTKYLRDTAPTMTGVPTTSYTVLMALRLHQHQTQQSTPARGGLFSIWRSADNSVSFGAFLDATTDRLFIEHDNTEVSTPYVTPADHILRLALHYTGDEIVVDVDDEEVARIAMTTGLGSAGNRLDVCGMPSVVAPDAEVYEFWISNSADIQAMRQRARWPYEYDSADTDVWVHFRFREGTGSTTADEVGRSTLTLTGSPTWITDPDPTRWLYFSETEMEAKAADLDSAIRPEIYDAANDADRWVDVKPWLAVPDDGFVEDVGGPQPNEPEGWSLGGNTFTAQIIAQAQEDSSGGAATVPRWPLDRLRHLKWAGGDCEVWRYAPARADGSEFVWSTDAEREFTGKIASEPGTGWQLDAVSALRHQQQVGLVREKYDGCGAGIDFPNTDGALNAYLTKSSPGTSGWPTTSYQFGCQFYAHELPSERSGSTPAALFEQWGGGSNYLTFVFLSSDLLRVGHNTTTLLTTGYSLVKNKLRRIVVLWASNEVVVFENGREMWRGAYSTALPSAPGTSLALGQHSSSNPFDGWISEAWLSNSGDEDLARQRSAGPLDYSLGLPPSDLVYHWTMDDDKSGTTVLDAMEQADLAFAGSPGPAWVPVAGTVGPMEGPHPLQGGGDVGGTTKQVASGVNYNVTPVLMSTLAGELQSAVGISALGPLEIGRVRDNGIPVAVPINEGNSITSQNFQFITGAGGRDDEIHYTGTNPAIWRFFWHMVSRPSASETVLRFTGTASNNADYTVSEVLTRLGDTGTVAVRVAETVVAEGPVSCNCVEASAADAAVTPTMDSSEGYFKPAAKITTPTMDVRTQIALPRSMLQQIYGLGLDDQTPLLDRTYSGTWPTDSLTYGTGWASGFFVPRGQDTPRGQLMITQLKSLFGGLLEAADATHTLKNFLPPDENDATITVDESLIEESGPRSLGSTPTIREMRVSYAPNRTVQSSLHTSVDPQDASRWSQPHLLTAPWVNPDIDPDDPPPGAVRLTWPTELARKEDAEELLFDVLAPFYGGEGREWFSVPVAGSGGAWEPKHVAGYDTVILKHPRHGLANGKAFVVQRILSTRTKHRAVLIGYV